MVTVPAWLLSNRDNVPDGSADRLARIAEMLPPDVSLGVEGYSDDQGSDAENEYASYGRAQAVRDVLAANDHLSHSIVAAGLISKSTPMVIRRSSSAGNSPTRRPGSMSSSSIFRRASSAYLRRSSVTRGRLVRSPRAPEAFCRFWAPGDMNQIAEIDLDGLVHKRLMTLSMQVWFMDAAADGTIYVDQVERPFDVLRTPLTGGVPERLAETAIGAYAIPLPDGRAVFISSVANRATLLVAQSAKSPTPFVETDQETNAPVAMLGKEQIVFRLKTGNAWIVAVCNAADGRIVRRLESTKGFGMGSIAGSVDGKTIYYTAWRTGKRSGKVEMKNDKYAEFEALDPFFDIVLKGLQGLVDGTHFFETIAVDAVFEFRYEFPGWPTKVQGRKGLMDAFSGYGNNIKLHAGDHLVVHRCQDDRVVILEYQVHVKVLGTGGRYDNRFISIITIENRKMVHWVDNMDSLAAWKALNGG